MFREPSITITEESAWTDSARGPRSGATTGCSEQVVARHHEIDRALRSIATQRSGLDVEEAKWLRIADSEGVWHALGFVHGLEYLEEVFGYRPRTAKERLRVARELGDLPELAQALGSGELNYSVVRELSRVATPETVARWIDRARGRTLRDVEQMVSGRKKGDDPDDAPDPALVDHDVHLELDAESHALWRDLRKGLEEELGRSLDDKQLILELHARAFAPPVTDNAEASQVDAEASSANAEASAANAEASSANAEASSANAEASAANAEASSANAEASSANAEASAANAAASAANAEASSANAAASAANAEASATRAAGTGTGSPVPSHPVRHMVHTSTCPDCRRAWRDGAGLPIQIDTRTLERARCDALVCDEDRETTATQVIPERIRRKVMERDRWKCTFPACRSARHLEVHHVRHREDGGDNDPANLTALCSGHHALHHDGVITIAGLAPDSLVFLRGDRPVGMSAAQVDPTQMNRAVDPAQMDRAVDPAQMDRAVDPAQMNRAVDPAQMNRAEMDRAVDPAQMHPARSSSDERGPLVSSSNHAVARHAGNDRSANPSPVRHASGARDAQKGTPSKFVKVELCTLAKAALTQSGFKPAIAKQAVEAAWSLVGPNADLTELIKGAFRLCK